MNRGAQGRMVGLARTNFESVVSQVDCPLRRGRRFGRGLFALRHDPISFSGQEMGKRNRPGNHSIKVPRDPSSRPRGSAPLDPRREFTGTRDEKTFMRKDLIILKLMTWEAEVFFQRQRGILQRVLCDQCGLFRQMKTKTKTPAFRPGFSLQKGRGKSDTRKDTQTFAAEEMSLLTAQAAWAPLHPRLRDGSSHGTGNVRQAPSRRRGSGCGTAQGCCGGRWR